MVGELDAAILRQLREITDVLLDVRDSLRVMRDSVLREVAESDQKRAARIEEAIKKVVT